MRYNKPHLFADDFQNYVQYTIDYVALAACVDVDGLSIGVKLGWKEQALAE